jgi:hypothetical protein
VRRGKIAAAEEHGMAMMFTGRGVVIELSVTRAHARAAGRGRGAHDPRSGLPPQYTQLIARRIREQRVACDSPFDGRSHPGEESGRYRFLAASSVFWENAPWPIRRSYSACPFGDLLWAV